MSAYVSLALLAVVLLAIGVLVASVFASRKEGPGHGVTQHEGHYKKKHGKH